MWAVKAGYDWIVLDRLVNTSYPPSHISDYLEFIAPLLCIGAMIVLRGDYRQIVGRLPWFVLIGLFLLGAYHFADAFLNDSEIPFGLLFLFTGLVTVFIGIAWLSMRLRKAQNVPKTLFFLFASLACTIILFCFSSFLRDWLSQEQLTEVTVVLMMLFGLHFTGISTTLFLIDPQKYARSSDVNA